LLLRGGLLMLLLLTSLLMLLLLRTLLALLLLGGLLVLLLLTSLLMLLLLGTLLALLLLSTLLTLLLLSSLIVRLHRCGDSHVAICSKRLADSRVTWPTMIDIGKLSPIRAGRTLVLYLCSHGRGVLLMQSRQFRGPGAHLHTARSTVEAHAIAATAVIAEGTVVHVVYR